MRQRAEGQALLRGDSLIKGGVSFPSLIQWVKNGLWLPQCRALQNRYLLPLWKTGSLPTLNPEKTLSPTDQRPVPPWEDGWGLRTHALDSGVHRNDGGLDSRSRFTTCRDMLRGNDGLEVIVRKRSRASLAESTHLILDSIGRNSYIISMNTIVSEKGQVTIPKPLRERLGIRPGQILDFSEEQGRLVVTKVTPQDPVDSLYGILTLGRPTDDAITTMRGKADAV